MNHTFRLFLTSVGLVFFFLGGTAYAMRCGTELVSEGDRAFMVSKKCGDPVSKEIIGYTLDEKMKREMVIEEWVYGPRNGYYYFLTFIGGRLTKISSEKGT